jgi:hypothetical protein
MRRGSSNSYVSTQSFFRANFPSKFPNSLRRRPIGCTLESAPSRCAEHTWWLSVFRTCCDLHKQQMGNWCCCDATSNLESYIHQSGRRVHTNQFAYSLEQRSTTALPTLVLRAGRLPERRAPRRSKQRVAGAVSELSKVRWRKASSRKAINLFIISR